MNDTPFDTKDAAMGIRTHDLTPEATLIQLSYRQPGYFLPLSNVPSILIQIV